MTRSGKAAVKRIPKSAVLGTSASVTGSSTQSSVAASSRIGLGRLIMESFGSRGSGSGGIGGVKEWYPECDSVAGVSVTNGTSVTSTLATKPTQTTVFFAMSARGK